MNFNNILIGSADPQRLVDYYTNMFGKPTMEEGGYTGWMIGSGFAHRTQAGPPPPLLSEIVMEWLEKMLSYSLILSWWQQLGLAFLLGFR